MKETGMSDTGAVSLLERLDQKSFQSHYFYVEAVIDHPIERVWKRALHIGDWMNDYRLETIAGTAAEVGHLQRVYPPGVAPETPQPHYHLYGIAEIVPFKCIALEVFPERDGSYGNTERFIDFDAILLSDLGGRTRVAFLQIYVHPDRKGDHPTDAREQQLLQGRDATLRERLLGYFGNLGRLAGES